MIRLLLIQLSILTMALAADQLRPGDMLPTLSGKTLSGKQAELPAADKDSNRAVVFSFSKAAGADSRLWNERLEKENGSGSPVVSYTVIMLEAVPRLIRGMAVSGIKGGMPQARWDRTILSYKDEDSWKKRLGVSADKYSYVVLLDGGGRICWLGSGPFTDSGYAGLKDALSRLRQSAISERIRNAPAWRLRQSAGWNRPAPARSPRNATLFRSSGG